MKIYFILYLTILILCHKYQTFFYQIQPNLIKKNRLRTTLEMDLFRLEGGDLIC